MKQGILVAALVTLAAPGLSHAATPVAGAHQPQAQATDLTARRHQHDNRMRQRASYEPHYYARPYYYRPYPYSVPYPFVLGFGPWW